MKVSVFESDNVFCLELRPETISDFSMLYRLNRIAKVAEKVISLHMSICKNDTDPVFTISMRKRVKYF